MKVTRLDSPRALKFDVVVRAKLDDVWTAFTTSEGLDTWLWQDCTVELRNGGGWTVHYPGGNAQLLGQLNYRFVNGPIPWKKP